MDPADHGADAMEGWEEVWRVRDSLGSVPVKTVPIEILPDLPTKRSCG